MAIDIDKIRSHYAKMTDSKLEQIAKFEIVSLQPEVQPIVIEEIKKRGLDENLLDAIEAQTKELSEEEIYQLRDKVKGLVCPICGKPNQGLVGSTLRKVRSYVIFTQYESRPIIACRSCVDSQRKNQLIKNSLLGWWSFPWGLLYRTPQAIINHFIDNAKKDELSEKILIDFAIQNIGELKTNWDHEERIVDYIDYHNNMDLY